MQLPSLFSFYIIHFLLVQFPGYTILGVLYLESGFSQGIANLVAGSPVLGRLCLGTEVENHVHYLALSLFTSIIVGSLLTLQAEKVEGEEMHGV